MTRELSFEDALGALQTAVHTLGGRLTGGDQGALASALSDVEDAGAALAAAQPETLTQSQVAAATETRASLDRMMQTVRLMSDRTERRLQGLRQDGGAVSYTKAGITAAMPRTRARTSA